MDKNKFLKNITKLNLVLIFVGIVNYSYILSTVEKEEEKRNSTMEKYFKNELYKEYNIYAIKEEYNFQSPNNRDYYLALKDIFRTKLNFLYLGQESQTENKNTDKATNNNNTQVISENSLKEARDVLQKGEKMLKMIDSNYLLSPSFKKIFKNNLNELSILVKDDSSIDIINIYIENIDNEDFQQLLEKQETSYLWKKYFESKFGKDINPIAYLQDGSFHKKEGVK